MEIEAWGEIGGEWISAVQGAEPDSWIVGILNVWSSAYLTAIITWTELTSDELLMAATWSGTVVVWQQGWDCGIPGFPQFPAMRLQQPRSAALMEAAGMTQAMIGVANKSSDKIETPSLKADLICLWKV
jgi:hypothetical protein